MAYLIPGDGPAAVLKRIKPREILTSLRDWRESTASTGRRQPDMSDERPTKSANEPFPNSPSDDSSPPPRESAERKSSLTKRQRMLIDEAVWIEQQDATNADAIGTMARMLAQVTLPHTDPKTLYYERTTGKLQLSIRGHKAYGVPYGTMPRVILAWICTEAAQTRSPELNLGRSAADFARKLGIRYDGPYLARLKRQSLALARALISIDGRDGEALAFEDIKIANRGFMFWSDRYPEQPTLWESTIVLTQDFFEAVTTRPVPINLQVYHALSKSPLAMDIYTWLTYRMFLLRVSRRPHALIPWDALKNQFGNGYADDAQGLRDFRKKFIRRLKEVLLFYPEASGHIQDAGENLRLTPCVLHLAHTGQAKLSKIPKPGNPDKPEK